MFIGVRVTDGSTVNFSTHHRRPDAVQFGNTGQIGIKFKAGFLAHSFPEIKG